VTGSVALCWGTPCGRALAQHSIDTSVTFALESDRIFAPATRFLPPAAREFAHPSTTQEHHPGSAPLLFRQRVHDAWVASDVQLYRDLWAWPRRGREQAAHLRAERLTF